MNRAVIFVRNHWHQLMLVFILLVAAYLRLYRIEGYMTFLGDEGRDVLVVKRMIVDHKLTLLGPTASVGGFFLGPIYYYFMVPFLWAWRLNPVGPAVMVALVGIATVWLVYKVGKEFYSPIAGLIAAGLYALSPVVIAYSRSSWNPNIVPFFALVLIYSLWLLPLRAQKTLPAFVVGVMLGIGLQLHYLFLFLFAVTAVWYIWRAKDISFVRSAAVSFGGFLAGYSPFLAFEIRHGFPNTISIVNFILEKKEAGYANATFFPIVSDVVFRLFGRLVFRLPQPELWAKFSPTASLALTGLIWLTIAGSLGYLIWEAVRRQKKGSGLGQKTRSAFQLLVCWLGIVSLLFGFYHKGIYDYYFGIFFPLPFLFVGIIAARLSRLPYVKWAAGTAVAALLLVNWQGRPFLHPPNNQLAQMRRISEVAFSKTDGKPFNFALMTDGNSDHAYRYFFEVWGSPPVTIENTQVDPQRTSVTDQLIIICEKPECHPLGDSLWEIAGFGRAEVVGQWDVPFVKVFKLIHYNENK